MIGINCVLRLRLKAEEVRESFWHFEHQNLITFGCA